MKYLFANWKMYLNGTESLNLAKQYKKRLKNFDNLEIAIAPNFLCLKEIKEMLGRSNIKLACQNVASQKEGAFTGEISALMLKDVGCQYAFVGHSERRRHLNETSEMINCKMNQCYQAGLLPVLSVGETFEEKHKGQQEAVLVRQLQGALNRVDGLPENELFIAYEPVWAIGSGKNMEPRELQFVYRVIKRTLSGMFSEKFYDEKVHLLYGGSVNSINAKGFWQSPYIQGLLAATASLDAEVMYNIALSAQ